MPLLFYGTPSPTTKVRQTARLYGPRLQLIETRVFDGFMIDKLGPRSKREAIANLWWFRERGHTAISWHVGGVEQTIWMPGLHLQRDALMIAREAFPEVIPSPIVFRFNNERKAYTYD